MGSGLAQFFGGHALNNSRHLRAQPLLTACCTPSSSWLPFARFSSSSGHLVMKKIFIIAWMWRWQVRHFYYWVYLMAPIPSNGEKKSNDCMLSRSYKTLRVLIISSLFCLRFSLFTTNKNTYRSYLEWVPLRSSMPCSSSEFTSISQWGFNKLEACEDSFWIWVGCSGRGLRDLSEKIGNHGLWLIGLQEMLK